ncbi:beta-propeller domain-containing protein [Aeromicrobium sp.]|nr:beta-propeller domain-containing protein [Candidatus Saccharibacteria bacterium]
MIHRQFGQHWESGATIVEVLVAIALTGIFLPVLATALVTANAGHATTTQQLQAQSLLREATDAVRSVREKGWANVVADGTYHPVISGSTWSLTNGAETIGGLTRQIVITTPQRNVAGAIVPSGGANDPSTKHVVVTVSWTKPASGSLSTDSYMTRNLSNVVWTQTSQTDFTAGTLNNVNITNTAGGEVMLNAGGSGISYASPTVASTLDITGVTDANDVYMDTNTSRAYVVNGTSLSIINVANPAAPVLLGTYSAGLLLNGVYVVGNYAYIASSSDTAELTVVNVTTPSSPTLAGSLNLGDTADATSIYVSGSNAYVGKILSSTTNINEFYVVNVSTPTSPSLAGSLNLTGNINSVCVKGNYAYVATAITTAELTIINITTPTLPVQAGVYDAAGTAAANDVFCGSTYIYLAEASNTGGPELFIIDPSTPVSPTLTGSYEVGNTVYGVAVAGAEAFLLTAVNNKQFTVLDTTIPSAPVVEGVAKITVANDIYVANNNAYLASTDNVGELTVMQGSASTGGQSASGTYESPTLDSGNGGGGFNSLAFTISQPTNTTVSFQIATNNDNATWSYVGPDGTARSQYTAAGAIPLGLVGNRYLRYKAALYTTTKTVLPLIYDVTVNYSP